MKDLYKILEVDFSVPIEEIRTSYRKLSLKYHPDKQSGKSEEEKYQAEEKFKEISNAYEILSDPESRKKYDDDNRNNYRSPSDNSNFDPSSSSGSNWGCQKPAKDKIKKAIEEIWNTLYLEPRIKITELNTYKRERERERERESKNKMLTWSFHL